MLELGRAGAEGVGKNVMPVLDGGRVVATVRANNWKESATVVIGDREWAYSRARRELSARWAVDPEGTVRLRARQISAWKGTWELDLDGVRVERVAANRWKGTHRFLVDGRPVAESGTVGWAGRPTLTAEASLPLEHQVFLLWFERVMRVRDSSAAAAAT